MQNAESRVKREEQSQRVLRLLSSVATSELISSDRLDHLIAHSHWLPANYYSTTCTLSENSHYDSTASYERSPPLHHGVSESGPALVLAFERARSSTGKTRNRRTSAWFFPVTGWLQQPTTYLNRLDLTTQTPVINTTRQQPTLCHYDSKRPISPKHSIQCHTPDHHSITTGWRKSL